MAKFIKNFIGKHDVSYYMKFCKSCGKKHTEPRVACEMKERICLSCGQKGTIYQYDFIALLNILKYARNKISYNADEKIDIYSSPHLTLLTYLIEDKNLDYLTLNKYLINSDVLKDNMTNYLIESTKVDNNLLDVHFRVMFDHSPFELSEMEMNLFIAHLNIYIPEIIYKLPRSSGIIVGNRNKSFYKYPSGNEVEYDNVSNTISVNNLIIYNAWLENYNNSDEATICVRTKGVEFIALLLLASSGGELNIFNKVFNSVLGFYLAVEICRKKNYGMSKFYNDDLEEEYLTVKDALIFCKKNNIKENVLLEIVETISLFSKDIVLVNACQKIIDRKV